MDAIRMDTLLKGLRKSGGIYITLAAEINLHHKRAMLHKVSQNIIDLFPCKSHTYAPVFLWKAL